MTIFSSGFRRAGARVTAFVALTAVLSAGLVGVSSATAAPQGVQIDTAPVVVQVQEATRAAAALSGSNFDPGYIISDWSFYNANGMTQAQIQSFLDGKCPTNNCIDTKKMTTTARVATNMCPTPYAAASNETFAAIIYKVQRSCGISAKVILVTLQKEQGLLTLQNPTDLKLRKAMGMGCPDTSVCDSKYYGFFNQVYYGASQLKRYGLRTSDNVSFRTKYQIGIPYPVAYKTVAACGTRSVTVKTKATTALYYYTPYTPNAKALANLTGTGDSCSSYGNRNFWVYYNSWFGNSLAGRGNDAITALYEKLGGASGALGTAGTAPNCATSSTCSQNFAHGVVHWTLASGAFAASGAIGDYYLAKGGVKGALGAPKGNVNNVVEPANGNGAAQSFINGIVHSSPAGTFQTSGDFQAAHTAAGWVRGSMGWPTSEKTCALPGAACSQTFQHGAIIQAKGGVARAIADQGIYDSYVAAGGPSGALGLPTSATTVLTVPAHGDGVAQGFTGGMIHKSAAGTFLVPTQVLTAYSKAGWVRGALGWPIAAATCGLPSGACAQKFQNGTVFAQSNGTGFAVVDPAINATYESLGGAGGSVGYPTTANTIVSTTTSGNGVAQGFTGGMIHKSAAGTFLVPTTFMTAFSKAGWVRGALGWPTAAQVCGSDGGCSQKFQRGSIYSAPGKPAFAVDNAKIATLYAAQGGQAGAVGYPTTATNAITTTKFGSGFAQGFTGGMIHSGPKGTFLVTTSMLAKYSAAGWVRGKLGWPIAAQVCAANGGACTQKFQGGTLTAQP